MKVLYSAFKQTLLVIAGSIIGIFMVTFKDILLHHWKLIIVILLILIFVGSGLLDRFNNLIVDVKKRINTKRKIYALLTPYEILDGQTSSWVNLSIDDIYNVYREKGIRISKIKSVKDIFKFPIVINPYGGSYPETNLDKLESFDQILDYVKRGGAFINIADIPFYYAYSEIHGRNIDTTPIAGSYQLDRSFFQTLITYKLATNIIGLNDSRYPKIERIFILNTSIKNLFKTVIPCHNLGNGSPFIALSYKLGYFVFSTKKINDDNKKFIATMIKITEKLINIH